MSDADKSAVSNDSTGLSDSILKDLLPTDIRADLEGDFEGCARLDDAAIRSLNVFSEKSNLNKTQVRSLFDVLGQCCTKAGLRTLDQWLRNPLVDLIRLTVRQELVQFFVDDSGIRWDMSKEHLIKVISLPMKDYANKLKARQLSLRKCCDLFLAIRNLKPLMLKLKKHSEASDVDPENEGCAAEHLRERVRRCYTNPLALYTRMLSNFIKVMDKAIDPESLDSGDPLISHTVDADLEHLHDQMSALRKEAQKALVKVADLIDADPNKEVRLQCDNEIGFLYRTSRRVDDKLRSKSGLEVIATKKDGIRFTDSKLKQLNGRYLSLHADYEQAQKHKVDELMETLSSFWEVIARLADLLTHLDVIVGLAIAAESADGGVAPYVRPQLLPSADGILCLKQARHPVLERMANVYYMPNDIELNRAKRRFVILTGPNMGGKSTFMRSIGCCVILAQIGSFVPAEEATVSLLDGFLTRVGASDAQSLGESTFLTEMKDTAHLLVSAGPHSLVIIDELGRGTSTFDGYGLAKSISWYFIIK